MTVTGRREANRVTGVVGDGESFWKIEHMLAGSFPIIGGA